LIVLDSAVVLTISALTVSIKEERTRAATSSSTAFVPALRLGRLWQVRLGERARTWTIRPGDTADRDDALDIRRRVYDERFGDGHRPDGDDLDARAYLCVVRLADGTPVASLRVVGPDDRPLEIESALPPLEDMLGPDIRPSEMNRFSILPGWRTLGTGIHMALFQWAFSVIRRDRASHVLVLAPEDVRSIYSFLLFEPIGEQYMHPRVGVSCTPMVLDLRNMPSRYRTARPAFARLLDPDEAIAPELRVS
jgi:hypothetical protein